MARRWWPSYFFEPFIYLRSLPRYAILLLEVREELDCAVVGVLLRRLLLDVHPGAGFYGLRNGALHPLHPHRSMVLEPIPTVTIPLFPCVRALCTETFGRDSSFAPFCAEILIAVY
jgi:hypothetical protein